MTTYAQQIAAAVIEAAAERLDQTADRYARRDADAIRSLDIDAIIASVPGPEAVAYLQVDVIGERFLCFTKPDEPEHTITPLIAAIKSTAGGQS